MFFLLTRFGCLIIYDPVLSKTQGGNNSVVECNLAKVEVASSNLVSRSNIMQKGSALFEPFFINCLTVEEPNENVSCSC